MIDQGAGRRRNPDRRKVARPLALGTTILALAWWGWFFGLPSLLSEVVRPLARTMVFIFLGLLIGQLLEAGGYAGRAGRMMGPLLGWARLPAQAGLSFMAAFVSGVTANSLLYNAWAERRISRRELTLANLLNASLPSYLLHLPTTLFIILALVAQAGLIYLGLTLAAALLRFGGVLLAARLILPPRPVPVLKRTESKPGWREIWAGTRAKVGARLIRMALLIVPIYLAVRLAARMGFFDWLKTLTASWISTSLLPVEAMGVVIFALAAEFTSGFAAAGALLETGQLGVREVVLALMAGTIISAPIRALRHQMGHYMAIFSPGLGLGLMALGQTVRLASLALVLGLFILLNTPL